MIIENIKLIDDLEDLETTHENPDHCRRGILYKKKGLFFVFIINCGWRYF